MKVLLVQLGFIGDCVLSTHLPEAIVQQHPEAEVTVLTTPIARSLFADNRWVAETLSFAKRGDQKGIGGLLALAQDLRQRNFTICYSLHRSIRTTILLALARIPHRVGFVNARGAWLYHVVRDRPKGEHDVRRNLAILGNYAETEYLSTRMCLVPPERNSVSEKVREWVAKGVHRPYAVVFPGSVWFTKRWSEEGFRRVVMQLVKEGYRVCVLGAPNEQEGNRRVTVGCDEGLVADFTGLTSLRETIWIVAQAGLLVCNDSMALHLGSALKVPTVTIFCATSPFFGFGPWQNRALVVQHEALECKPCRRHGSNACPTGTELCMTGVSPAQVMKAVRQLAPLSAQLDQPV